MATKKVAALVASLLAIGSAQDECSRATVYLRLNTTVEPLGWKLGTFDLNVCDGWYRDDGANQTGLLAQCDSETSPTKVELKEWNNDWQCELTGSADSDVYMSWKIVDSDEDVMDIEPWEGYAWRDDVVCSSARTCTVQMNYFYPTSEDEAGCTTDRDTFDWKKKENYPRGECNEFFEVWNCEGGSYANVTSYQFENCTGSVRSTQEFDSLQCNERTDYSYYAKTEEKFWQYMIVRECGANHASAIIAAVIASLFALVYSH